MVAYDNKKVISYDGYTMEISLHFSSSNGFFAQTPISFYGSLNSVYPRTILPFGYGGDTSHNAYIFFKDATINGTNECNVLANSSGAYIELNNFAFSSSYLTFPFEGDYEAFLIFTNTNISDKSYNTTTFPLGKVIHASSPESAILFKTNQVMTGLSLIVTGMTIIQIWISLRGRE